MTEHIESIMPQDEARTGLQLRSLVKNTGDLELSLTRVPIPTPASNEVLLRVEAAPINPSDLGLLFAGADMSKASQRGTKDSPVVMARVPDAALKSLAARFDVSMPVGNEGAGVVVEAGASEGAQAFARYDGRRARRRNVCAISLRSARAVSGPAGRRIGCRWRILLRQSPDRAGYDRDHAP